MTTSMDTRIDCYKCGKGKAALIDPPDDIEAFPGIPRWVCDFCLHFWLPSDQEISALGLQVPTAREREKWRSQ